MDIKTRLSGLEQLLAIIYGNEMCLNLLLRELGFEQSQINQLQNGHLEPVITQFLEIIHKRLTSDSGKDTYYQILSRRFGLDGEPPQQLSAIAEKYAFHPEYLHRLFEETIERCQTKTWQKELRNSLKHITVKQLKIMQELPTREHVVGKLERLSTLRDAAEFARLDYETRRKELLKMIQADLDALEAEFKPVLDAAQENVAKLENEIRIDVLCFGESISGGMYRAIYTQGRVSWDNDGMALYAASHPEVFQYRKQGQPIVSLKVLSRN